MALFIVLFVQLVQLMLVNGEEYAAMSGTLKQREISIPGARGSILDRNGLPLAYDEKSYNVQFYRDPTTSTETDRAYYTSIIIETIDIIEKNDGEMIDTFVIKHDDATDEYVFDWGIENEEFQKSREANWRTNMYVGKERTPEQIYLYLRDKYQIPPEMGYEDARKVLSVWQESQLNSWVAYEPVTIAFNVNMQTVAEIETHKAELTGMSIEDSTVRVYPKGNVAAHEIGYLGKMPSESDLDLERIEEYVTMGYDVDDLVGVEGVEKSMEALLTGNSALRQGKETVEVDNVAVIQNVLSSTQPTQGYNVMLTLDIPMQTVVEQSLEKNVKKIHQAQVEAFNLNEDGDYTGLDIDKLKLAVSGAAVVLDIHTGEVLAMASYPSFDLNQFVGGISDEEYDALKDDPSKPLFNNAISSRSTPGSIFKMVTGTAALMEGEKDKSKGTWLGELISCKGRFVVNEDAVAAGADPQGPRCWKIHNYETEHANQDIVLGLEHSCNYYFCTLASRLGIDLLDKWSDKFGLTSSTGIELPNEVVGMVGSQKLLFDASKDIDEQATSRPILVMETGKYSIVNIINEYAASIETEYDQELVKETAKEIVYLLGIVWTADTEDANVLKDEDGVSMGDHVRRILSDKLGIPTKKSGALMRRITSEALTQLQWSTTLTANTGIGQGITQLTPIAVARYVASIVNGGTVYQTHIVDKVVAQDGTVLLDKQPEVFDTLDANPEYLEKIKEGMGEVVAGEDGTVKKYFEENDFPDEYLEIIGGKTGTAQVSDVDLENNSWFVCFAPYEDPQIAIVSYVPNGFAGGYSSWIAQDILLYYFHQQEIVAEQTIPDSGSLVYQSPGATPNSTPSETDTPE